jgi:hypothetical protein
VDSRLGRGRVRVDSRLGKGRVRVGSRLGRGPVYLRANTFLAQVSVSPPEIKEILLP